MKNRIVLSIVLIGVCLGGLVGCDGKKAEEKKAADEAARAAEVVKQMRETFEKSKEEGRNRANADITRVKIMQVRNYIDEFRLIYRKFPDSFNDLTSCTQLTGDGCVPIVTDEKEFNDAWGNRLKYEKREKEQILEQIQLKKSFLTNLSKELEDPLGNILSPISTMLSETTDTEMGRQMVHIQQEAETLSTVIRQIANFGQPEKELSAASLIQLSASDERFLKEVN